ncbi:MAG: urea ABC transporter permease subunit UrtB [Litoreibacter sp.]|uniref:urea ABC transporter permease subunit UrtB n=1 Tax=Litoreibacter sp. TaxID=1969459 RepID=UPI003299A564
MKTLLLAMLAALLMTNIAQAQATSVSDVLQSQRELIEKSSRRTIGPAIDAIAESGLPQMQGVLEAWQSKNMWQRKEDGSFFLGAKNEDGSYALTDFEDGAPAGDFDKKALKQLKPNSGVRAMIATALVKFQLSDPDPVKRMDALTSISRDPDAALLAPLRASIEGEADAAILARKTRLERLMTMAYDADASARVDAIGDMAGDLGVDFRATLNPILRATLSFTAQGSTPDANVAEYIEPGSATLSKVSAYDLLVEADLAAPIVTDDARDAALEANVEGGFIAGMPIAQLSTEAARNAAYDALVADGLVAPRVGEADIDATLAGYRFFNAFTEANAEVTTAARQALAKSENRVAVSQAADLGLDALSLASIYFLAAIGLAITFGVMGVINMAHGEFIMMGAYTGYVVQQFVPNHTLSIILAVPLAFAVTFAAGVLLERLVIRWLYHRPLETLLATFGVSIALQQLAKNIFGTQARPLTAPSWLDGAWVINDVVSISYIRIAIFVLALTFLGLFLFIMKQTRLGLETRAVTQNPRMAASMGINPDRVNMLTFGLGSGIAGIAGVAIGLFAKVTSEMGGDYIVQSFMTVVVGGVGNIWGTLAGAAMIGGFQKGVEWLNPSNTLAAQTYMIIFIIIFIQFRPRGIIALKGRAAGD